MGLLLPLAVLDGCGGAVDPRQYPLVAALDREIAVAARAGAPGVTVAGRCAAVARREGEVFVPYGSSLTLLVDLPPDAALRVSRVARCGDGIGTLRVVTARDGEDASRRELAPASTMQAVPMPRGAGPARIELWALAGSSPPPPGGLLLAGLFLGARDAAGGPAVAVTPPPTGRRPNILIYLVDALRRDGLGCYGGRPGVSPHLDSLAAEATVFDDAVAQGAWTRPTVASLLTGLTPEAHGVFTTREALAEEAVTLGELLQPAGYRTVGLVANGNVDGHVGFRQGFDHLGRRIGKDDSAGALIADLELWLDDPAQAGRPFFAYLHTVEPHGPYKPVEPFRSRFAPGVPPELGTRRSLRLLEEGTTPVTPQTAAQLRQLYDAEVAANDDAFGQLRAWLETRDRWRDTVVVVLADHGEEFLEHGGWEHGQTLRQETLAIPLVVRVPGSAGGRRVARLAQQVDVLPTLLELAGVPVPAGLDGESLLPAIRGEETAPVPPARSYQRMDDWREAAVTTGAYRLLLRTSADGTASVALYDRLRDRQEQTDLATTMPITTAYLLSVLRWPQGRQGTLARPAGRPDREAEEQLRALGYLH